MAESGRMSRVASPAAVMVLVVVGLFIKSMSTPKLNQGDVCGRDREDNADNPDFPEIGFPRDAR